MAEAPAWSPNPWGFLTEEDIEKIFEAVYLRLEQAHLNSQEIATGIWTYRRDT